MHTTNTQTILSLAQAKGLLRTRDVSAAGAYRGLLAQMVNDGQLLRLGRGLYALPERAASEHDSLAEVAAKSAQGVVCLISALRFHNLTTQQSPDVWLAIAHKAHAPSLASPRLRVVRMSGAALTSGIETHAVGGVPVRVYCLAKTIVDCFKYRNKIGLDVALEALREAWREKRVTMDALWQYAQVCRVTNVMRPYLELLGVLG